MNEIVMMIGIYCSIFSSQDFHLSKYRKKTACSSTELIIKESKKNNIDQDIIFALIYVESAWKKTAVSSANACGLTQVIPKYTGKITKKYTCSQLKIPRNSIRAGIKTLKFWIDHHDGNVARGLCSYNAGYRCSYVKNKKGKVIKRPNRHGMRYAKKVLSVKNDIKQKYREKIKK